MLRVFHFSISLTLGAYAQRGFTCRVCLCVCRSIKSHLTSGASVRPENLATYSAGNEGQKIVAFSLKLCRSRATALPALYGYIGDGNTHTHKNTNKHKQETKVFHSLVSAMATKGATHPTTETVHVLPSSTMTQESGEECTGRYSRELPADLSATWAEGATHPDHDTGDDSNREYCGMPSAHV